MSCADLAVDTNSSLLPPNPLFLHLRSHTMALLSHFSHINVWLRRQYWSFIRCTHLLYMSLWEKSDEIEFDHISIKCMKFLDGVSMWRFSVLSRLFFFSNFFLNLMIGSQRSLCQQLHSPNYSGLKKKKYVCRFVLSSYISFSAHAS